MGRQFRHTQDWLRDPRSCAERVHHPGRARIGTINHSPYSSRSRISSRRRDGASRHRIHGQKGHPGFRDLAARNLRRRRSWNQRDGPKGTEGIYCFRGRPLFRSVDSSPSACAVRRVHSSGPNGRSRATDTQSLWRGPGARAQRSFERWGPMVIPGGSIDARRRIARSPRRTKSGGHNPAPPQPWRCRRMSSGRRPAARGAVG